MEWKKGMKVRCIEEYAGFNVGNEFTLMERLNGDGWDTNPSLWCYIRDAKKDNWEVVNMNIEVGDTIRLKMDATLEDLTKDYWNGCMDATLRFIKDADDGKTYDVVKASKNYISVIVNDDRTLVNINVVELVEKAKPKIKEYTMKELQDKLGEEFKLIK